MRFDMKKNIIIIFLVTIFLFIWFVRDIISPSLSHSLSPSGESIALSPVTQNYVYTPASSLELESLNSKKLRVKTNILSDSEDDFFTAKSTVAVKKLFEGLAEYVQSQGDESKANKISLIAKNIAELKTFRRPAHQYPINGLLGNRILFYGAQNEFDLGPGHKNIDKFTHDVGVPLVKVMTHFNEAQGGTLFNLLESGSGGMAHAGGYFAGWQGGKPVAVRSDWPAYYGVLGDDNVNYNAHLFAVDYQQGTNKVIPETTLENYNKNYALWDIFSGLLIPFVKESKVDEYKDYTNNPLEVFDRDTLENMATLIGDFDKSKINFTSYCAEGQWNTMNLAPNYLIKKGKYPKLDNIIETFQSAPGFKNMKQHERMTHPMLGWEWLHKSNLITLEMLKNLKITRRTSIYLDWVDDSTLPWAKYEPQRSDGLIADPMSLGTLVRMLLRTYFPREEVTRVIQEALHDVYSTGNKDVKAAVSEFLEGYSPETILLGNYVTGKAAAKLSGLQFAMLLNFDDFKNKLFNKLGYQHIVADEDRVKVESLYEKYIQTILNPEYDTREKFDSALAKIDAELASLQVSMKIYGPDDKKQRTKTAKVRFFMWAPPQAWAFWAQHPDMFNSRSIRYAATAMHYYQSKQFAINEAKQ